MECINHLPREKVPPVPDGRARLAEYGTTNREHRVEQTTLAQAPGVMHGHPTVRLVHMTRGWQIAGSMLRWDMARYSVLWTENDSSIHGRNFAETPEGEAEARALFVKWTDAQEVSRRRQQAAQRADEEREERAACEALAREVKIEAAKTYRSGWQFRAEYPGLRNWCGYAKTKKAALAEGLEAVVSRIRDRRYDERRAA